MKNRLPVLFTLLASSALFLAGCSDDNDSFEDDDSSDPTEVEANSGVISQKNFSLLTAEVAPIVIDASTNVFTKTDVELTVFIGDRNNQVLTDSHTINFVSDYGLVEPSCVTVDGTCSVTWSAIKRPDTGGPGDDGDVTITAYTKGEEGFIDTNGNNEYDEGDASFDDLEEPFVDADLNGVFSTGDVIIDTKSINDPSGDNKVHDIADGFYNGKSCSHTSLCGDDTSITIFDSVSMTLVGNATFTIGGTITFTTPGQTLVIQNNGGDDITLTNADTTYEFPAIDDGEDYAVTVKTAPAIDLTCTFDNTNDTGTLNGADITDVNITCAP